MNILDQLAYVTIVLFILSVIVEKITQLIRLYPWQTKLTMIITLSCLEVLLVTTQLDYGAFNPHLVVLFLINTVMLLLIITNMPGFKVKFPETAEKLTVMESINAKADVPVDQKEKQVMLLSFIIGFFIAYFFKANLLAIFAHPGENFGWDKNIELFTEWWVLNPTLLLLTPSEYFGFMLTGFFLTFGSKFFHDLLDTLLEVKHLKRKLNDSETFQINSVKQFDEYMVIDYHELARLCLEQNKARIEALPNLATYFVGMSCNPAKRKAVIILHSTVAQSAGYPTFLHGRLDSGKMFTVETEVVYNFDTPTIHLNAGDSINHINHAQSPGTICCNVVRDNRTFLLTCGHVMTGGLAAPTQATTNGWINSVALEDTQCADMGYGPVGDWCYVLINDEVDIALSLTTETVNPVVNVLVPPADYTPTLDGTEVFVNGKVNKTRAFVRGFMETDLAFQYNGSSHKLRNLILISKNKIGNPLTVTQGGDSGAMVYVTKNKIALGMVVGGNRQYTFLMPLSKILSETKTRLN